MVSLDPLFDIRENVYLVAGAGGGLGAPISAALLERGARLCLGDVDRALAEAAATAAGATGQAVSTELDIRDERSIGDAVQHAVSEFGRLDGVVNAAGVLHIAPAASLSVELFRESVEINLTGAFLLTRTVARAVAPGSRIVHIASASSFVANPGYAAYASSKAGLSQMVRVMARELAADRIAVNAIGPAVTETAMTRQQLADPKWRESACSLIPFGRFGTPQDLLGTLILLLAPGGAFITGQTIYVDGGRTLV